MQRRQRLTKTLVIAQREYLARVRTKGFWIATLLIPLVFGAMFALPVLVLMKSTASLDAVVVDETGQLGEAIATRLAGDAEAKGPQVARVDVHVVGVEADPEAQRAALDRRLLADDIDAWIWIGPEGLAKDQVEYHARSVSNTLTQRVIQEAISEAVQEMRLTEAGIDPETVRPLLASVHLRTIRVSEEGSRSEAGEAGFFLAYGIFFLLYIVQMLWGQQVLQGALEEKTSRIVEVVIASARPFDLMLGKLLGIGAAAFTQFSLWLATAVALTAPSLIAAIGALPEDVGLPTLSVFQAVAIFVFFILGFFVYASLFAAVGASFNNPQEAQQLAYLPMSMIILPLFFLFPVINDSNSTLGVVTSLLPPLTPILMPLRIAVEVPPLWQVGLAVVMTSLFVYFMVVLCGRVYRVGILMYGKKPTIKEIWRWVRYA